MELKFSGILLIDVKGSFDYVSRNGMMRNMNALGEDGNLVR